jgi:ribosomal protein S18 acetylase RimI-like enzyme
MLLTPAVVADLPAIVALVNRAYRGTGAEESWNTEAGLLDGPRLSEQVLLDDLAARPSAFLLTYRAVPQGEVMGTVWLEPVNDGVWYLGLLTVRPELQDQQLGRALMAAAEEYARQRGARRMRLSVVNVRTALIGWYERRGYRLTGESQPFPYDDERFGRPLRGDLSFLFLEKRLG